MLSTFVLSVGLSVCLSACPVLSVTLVHCGQTVGWIKMKLGTELGLAPGMRHGDPAWHAVRPRPNRMPSFILIRQTV